MMGILPETKQVDSTETESTSETQIKQPRMYKVLILNDDYTPMNFVVEVLERFFHMDQERATRIMLCVHYQGSAVCGVYTKDVAQTKALVVNEYARSHQYPLLCEIAPEVESS